VVPYREWLGLNSDGYLTGVTGPQPVHRQDDGLLRITARGPAVKALQLALNRAGAFLAVDGLFGQATHVAVMGYQGARDLPVDGVAGPRTIAALRADGLIGEDAP
jgi:peptidoglycan hydrolase-like protein with peptidoglycan-binding domain